MLVHAAGVPVYSLLSLCYSMPQVFLCTACFLLNKPVSADGHHRTHADGMLIFHVHVDGTVMDRIGWRRWKGKMWMNG